MDVHKEIILRDFSSENKKQRENLKSTERLDFHDTFKDLIGNSTFGATESFQSAYNRMHEEESLSRKDEENGSKSAIYRAMSGKNGTLSQYFSDTSPKLDHNSFSNSHSDKLNVPGTHMGGKYNKFFDPTLEYIYNKHSNIYTSNMTSEHLISNGSSNGTHQFTAQHDRHLMSKENEIHNSQSYSQPQNSQLYGRSNLRSSNKSPTSFEAIVMENLTALHESVRTLGSFLKDSKQSSDQFSGKQSKLMHTRNTFFGEGMPRGNTFENTFEKEATETFDTSQKKSFEKHHFNDLLESDSIHNQVSSLSNTDSVLTREANLSLQHTKFSKHANSNSLESVCYSQTNQQKNILSTSNHLPQPHSGLQRSDTFFDETSQNQSKNNYESYSTFVTKSKSTDEQDENFTHDMVTNAKNIARNSPLLSVQQQQPYLPMKNAKPPISILRSRANSKLSQPISQDNYQYSTSNTSKKVKSKDAKQNIHTTKKHENSELQINLSNESSNSGLYNRAVNDSGEASDKQDSIMILDQPKTPSNLRSRPNSPQLFQQFTPNEKQTFFDTDQLPFSPGLMRNFQTPGPPARKLLPEAFMTPIQNEFFRTKRNQSTITKTENKLQSEKRSKIEEEKSRACSYLHNGEFLNAIKTASQVLKRVITSYGEGHIDAVYLHILLGEAYTHSGNFKNAHKHLIRSREIIEKTSHCFEFTLYSVICYTDLGYLYRLQGNLELAFEMYTKVLSLKTKQFGKSSHEVASTYNDIGLVLTALGRFKEALSLLNESYSIRRTVLGENHIETATVVNNIGNTYMYLGQYEKALEYYRTGQSIMERNQLFEHPDMATCYSNIGSTLKELGRYSEAWAMYEKAKTLRESIYGPHHTSTAACYLSIGMLLVSQKDYERGIEYIEHARKIREMVLGSNDVETALCYSYAGHTLMLQKQYDQALYFYELARNINLELYGQNHPETIQCDENIANLKLQLGYTHDALKIMYKIAKYKKQFHGENHPCTATIYNNIGNVLRSQCKNKAALNMYLKAKTIYEAVYGFYHHSTSIVYANIGHILYWEGKYKEAVDKYIQSNAIREHLYGKTHKSYAMGLHNLAMAYKKQKQLRTSLKCCNELQGVLKDMKKQKVYCKEMQALDLLNDKLIAKLLRKIKANGNN